jgi:hypothetical protein
MPIYEMQCEDGSCGLVFETIANIDEQVDCLRCGFSAKRLIAASGVNTANQDADWIRSVLDVVDKDSSKPETREFLKRPTRDNMHNWMRAEGVRHYEKGERKRPPEMDMSKVYDHVQREHAARHI